MKWLPWQKDDVAIADPVQPNTSVSKTVSRGAGTGDGFHKHLTTMVETRGIDAAEQLIHAREERLWGRLSMLAEPLDATRAVVYAERYQASVSQWITWLQRSASDPNGTESATLTAPDDDLASLLRGVPAPHTHHAEPPLPEAFDRILKTLEQNVESDGFDAAEAFIAENQAKAWLGLAKLIDKKDRGRALQYVERAHGIYPTAVSAQRMTRLLYGAGNLVRSERMLREYFDKKDESPTPSELQRLAYIQGWKSLFLNGLPWPERSTTPAFQSIPDKVIYCLHNSLPHSSAGYGSRSHSLLRALANSGINAIGLTRYGYPWDMAVNRGKFPRAVFPEVDIIEDVTYRRMRTYTSGWSQVPTDRYIQACSEEIEAVAREERPAVIHAASNFLVGLSAVAAARRLGVPSIYEVRGLWEVTRASREPTWAESELYRTNVRLETQAACGADRVIAITNALKAELVRRGVPADHISVIPNSVDSSRFVPAPRDVDLERELGLAGKRVVGYVGTITDYEGLDHLLYAVSALIDRGVDNVHLLLVGDGTSFRELERLVTDLELDEYVTMTGRVPFDEVHRYYSLVDVAPFPRKPLPVTEMVSPLKPYEAMAMQKAVLVSSVAALAEMVDDGRTGLIFEKGNVDSLADALHLLVSEPDLCERLGEDARAWVVANRSWDQAGAAIAEIYRELEQDGSSQLSHQTSTA